MFQLEMVGDQPAEADRVDRAEDAAVSGGCLRQRGPEPGCREPGPVPERVRRCAPWREPHHRAAPPVRRGNASPSIDRFTNSTRLCAPYLEEK
jgi:hypothetical protein